MIDNFELIKPLFYFNEANNMFFHCQIVRRAKDHKPDKVEEGAIKTYFIRSREHLESLREEIILLCEHYGARAYINVTGKDFEAVNKHMLAALANNVCLNNMSAVNPRKVLNSVAGTIKSRLSKWIIDIDDLTLKKPIVEWLEHYFNVNDDYLYATIPTVQGEHLIVKPFNSGKFEADFPDVDVHKNSMGTLLYYPKVLDRPKYCCSECGGTNIQVQAWINPNTGQVTDTPESNDCWCEDCKDRTKLKQI